MLHNSEVLLSVSHDLVRDKLINEPLPVTPLVLRVRVVVDGCTATGWILGLACFTGERRTTVVHFGTSTSCRDDTEDVDTELAASIGHCDPSSGVGSTHK